MFAAVCLDYNWLLGVAKDFRLFSYEYWKHEFLNNQHNL